MRNSGPIDAEAKTAIDKFSQWLKYTWGEQQDIINRRDPEWMPFLFGDDWEKGRDGHTQTCVCPDKTDGPGCCEWD